MTNQIAKQLATVNQVASQFSSSIVIKFDDKNIDVKSILGLFTSLTGSATYELEVRGSDAIKAAEAVTKAFEEAGLKIDNIIVETI